MRVRKGVCLIKRKHQPEPRGPPARRSPARITRPPSTHASWTQATAQACTFSDPLKMGTVPRLSECHPSAVHPSLLLCLTTLSLLWTLRFGLVLFSPQIVQERLLFDTQGSKTGLRAPRCTGLSVAEPAGSLVQRQDTHTACTRPARWRC